MVKVRVRVWIWVPNSHYGVGVWGLGFRVLSFRFLVLGWV